MLRKIYTSSISSPDNIYFPYQGLSIDVDGVTAQVTITAWSERDQDAIDVTEEISGGSPLSEIGAVGIAGAIEDIDDFHKKNPELAKYHRENPVFSKDGISMH